MKKLIKSVLKMIPGLYPLYLKVRSPALVQSENVYQKAVERRCAEIAKATLVRRTDIASREYQTWIDGVAGELNFWYLSVALDGWSWASAYKLRLTSDYDFQFPECIEHFPDVRIECLEVGAGAMTSLGTLCQGKEIAITPTDALADAFAMIFRDFGVTPRFPVIPCDAESLLENFKGKSYHFIYANNCLDHCYDPVEAIKQMYSLLKPSGSIVLAHFVNVAEAEKYQGLHQWNFCVKDNRFCIWNKSHECFLDSVLPSGARVSSKIISEQSWITARIEKVAD